MSKVRVFGILLLAVLLVQLSPGQEKEDDIQIAKADQILKLVRKAIYKKHDEKAIKSVYVERVQESVTESRTNSDIEIAGEETRSRNIGRQKLSVAFPDLIRSEITSYLDKNSSRKDLFKTNLIVNGEDAVINRSAVIDGKPINLQRMRARINKIGKTSVKDIANIESKEVVQKGLWLDLYPILLNLPWNRAPKFKYIGKAEADGTRADVLEMILTRDAVDNIQKQIRLFFDENTHRLLMIIIETSSSKTRSQTTHYYSDYQEMDGLVLARKINTETVFSDQSGFEAAGIKSTGVVIRTTTEAVIEEFRVNPVFDSKIFEVKKN